MGPPVDAAREAGDDDHTGRCDPARELARDVGAVVGAATGADHRDCRPAQKLRTGVPPEKEPRRRVVDRAQPLGEGAVGASEPAQPSLAEHAQVGVSIERRLESREASRARLTVGGMHVIRRGERRKRELVHRCLSSVGER